MHNQMKNILFVLSLIFLSLFFAGCYSAKTTSMGLENVGYLQITGDTEKYSEVTVTVDGKNSFTAQVNDNSQRAVKNEYTYKIAIGSHTLEISCDGKTILVTKMFSSANQKKVIDLP